MDIDDYDDITGQRVIRDIQWAINGNREAATRLMEAFEDAVNKNIPVPLELLHYFACCFRAILDGATPKIALHLDKPKHRPEDRELWIRDAKLAVAVEEEKLLQKKTLEEAIEEVASRLHTSPSTVRRAYLQYKS